jgi:hypothetical protein
MRAAHDVIGFRKTRVERVELLLRRPFPDCWSVELHKRLAFAAFVRAP